MGKCPDQMLFFKKMITEYLLDFRTIIRVHVYVVFTNVSYKTDGRDPAGAGIFRQPYRERFPPYA